MPTKYIRKQGSSRGSWSEDALRRAITAVRDGMGINLAANSFNIPSRTLRRCLKNNDSTKKAMGPTGCFGKTNELKLLAHIKNLQKRGFAPTRDDLRTMAYNFAIALKLKHRFNSEKEKAGYDWVTLFLLRHPDLAIRKAEGVSVARAEGMSREKTMSYFELLHATLEEHGLFEKPGSIYNMDETGLQLNNKVDHVIAQKGSRGVSAITSGEKGETITVIACCNAEGTFLPPACVFKGKYKKNEFQDGMPNGSVIYMNQKSAYVNADIFLLWLREHFLPRKGLGKSLLIVDGHTSHCSAEVLELAENNDVILLCLPSHTTHYLQPLDRGVFKSLKSAFNKACHLYMKTHPSRKITRLQFGTLLAEAWTKAATNDNAISSFRATGIFPYNPDAIPEHAYYVSDAAISSSIATVPQPSTSSRAVRVLSNVIVSHANGRSTTPEPQPGPSSAPDQPPSAGKVLESISPLPTIPVGLLKARGRSIATILTSPENIENTKLKQKLRKKSKCPTRDRLDSKQLKRSKKSKPVSPISESDEEEEYEAKSNSDEDVSDEFNENECVGCLEEYSTTTRSDDWIKCVNCSRWMHENCTKFENMCDPCGKYSRKAI